MDDVIEIRIKKDIFTAISTELVNCLEIIREMTVDEDVTIGDCIDRQQPEKPHIIRDGDDSFPVLEYHCPCCMKDLYIFKYNYCPDCGQKIDWSDNYGI